MTVRQFTIKDLARKLGVSPSTVSRALRDHPDISRATKTRVNEAARKYHYQPNQIAQSLQKRRSNIIGVIVPQIRHQFFASVIGGIEDLAYEHGYTIMVCQSSESLSREILNTQALVANRVAGLIIAISSETISYDHLTGALRQGVPLVQFDRVVDGLATDKVVVDDYAAAYKATKHLVDAGYRLIGHLAGQEGIALSRRRMEGYRDALRDNGITPDPRYCLHEGYSEEDGRRGAERYMAMDRLPEAVLAINDPVALGMYTRFREAGIGVPRDVALVGFSDNPESALIEPGLTTVHQPAAEMGRRAVSLLMHRIEDRDTWSPSTVVLDTELRVRGSSTPGRKS